MLSDCGKHCRAAEFAGGVYRNWAEKLPAMVYLTCFVEKHGQGRVDALFSRVQAWIRSALLKPGTLLKEMDELVQALAAGAGFQKLQSS